MRADLKQDFVTEISPEVPSVADLHRVGQGTAYGLGVSGRAVTAHDLDTRMFAQPGLQHGRLATGLGIRDDRGVAATAAQGEIVHANHPQDRLRWRIEHDYREMKQALGLAHFEGRTWRGWHHHVTLVSAAHAFRTLQRITRSPKETAPA